MASDDERTVLEKLDDPSVRGPLDKMDDDSAKALSLCDKQLGDLDDCPSKFLDEFRDDRKALDKAMGDFNEAKTKGEGDVLNLYLKWFESLDTLQQANACCKALITLKVVDRAAKVQKELVDGMKEFSKDTKDAQSDLTQQLKKLQGELKDAIGKLDDFAEKAILKEFATEAAAFLAAETALPVAAIAIGGITVSVILEYVFGGEDIKKTTLKGLQKTGESIGKLDEDGKVFSASGQEWLTAGLKVVKKLDRVSDAVKLAFLVKHLNVVKAMIENVQKTKDLLTKDAGERVSDLQDAEKDLDSLVKDVKRARATTSNEIGKYEGLKNKIKKYLSE